MQRIKQNDQVILIAGKDKGKTGTVRKIVRDKAGDIAKVIVDGVNLVKKHVKPDPNNQVKGGIVEQEAALHISNVAILNPVTNKADKVKIKTLEDGKKVRCFKSNDEVIDI